MTTMEQRDRGERTSLEDPLLLALAFGDLRDGANRRKGKTMRTRAIEKIGMAAWLLLLLSGCQLGTGDKALELAKEIPQYPGSSFLGSFETGFPDDVPGSGVNYLSDDAPEDILGFYRENVSQAGWTLVEVYDHADDAVPDQLILERPRWRCKILIIHEDPRRINIKVERK